MSGIPVSIAGIAGDSLRKRKSGGAQLFNFHSFSGMLGSMAVFWLLAGVMTAVALSFVLVPLLRARAPAGRSAAEANLEALRCQRRELEADVAAGVIAPEARDEGLAELVQRAEADLSAAPAPVVADRKRSWIPAAIAAIAIPTAAFGLYLAIGAPLAADPRMTSAGAMGSKDVAELVDRLAQKVRERPDDARGWALLARSTAALGRFDESASAYEHLVKLAPGDAQVLADYADVRGMAQGRTLAGRPLVLAKSALDIAPDNRKALALAGTATMELGRFAEAIAYWEHLAGLLPPGSDDEKEVREVLAEWRTRAGMPPTTMAATKAPPAATKAAPGKVEKSVSGVVTVAPEVASKSASTDTICVFARAAGGPRAP